jgi:CubicO group peptidase (beta-lactamase class C family)
MGDYDLIANSYEGPAVEGSIDLRNAAGGPFRLGNEDYLTIPEFYDVVKRVPLAQRPGQSFLYSNLAYFLLSMLVEEVSGESLREYAQKRIFDPLGMQESFFSDDPVEIVKNRASGYARAESGTYVTDMTNLFWVGDGGLHTNLDDMLLWDQSFYEPVVGADPTALLARMNTPNSELRSESGALYANGQYVGERGGEEATWHSGGWLGTQTFYARFPQRRTSLVMMCNDASLDMEPLIDGAIAIILGETGASD